MLCRARSLFSPLLLLLCVSILLAAVVFRRRRRRRSSCSVNVPQPIRAATATRTWFCVFTGTTPTTRLLLLLRHLVNVSYSLEDSPGDLRERCLRELLQEASALSVLVPDSVARLYDVAHVVVTQQLPGRAGDASEKDLKDLREDHLVRRRVRRLEPAVSHGVHNLVHSEFRFFRFLADHVFCEKHVNGGERGSRNGAAGLDGPHDI
mmetsp:Transcript_4513/g.7874  ORF Transcript_4513/g.7874 Transcript_4513/m.7874 type:complete len:207 (-) Transcript_4513:181-801(-)